MKFFSPLKITGKLHWILVFVITLISCSPVSVLNSVITTEGYRVEKDLAFGSGKRQKLDLYIPDRISRPHKTIMFIYGGSWQYGSKSQYVFAAQALVSKGFIVAVPDYRLSPEISYPVFLEDNAKAFAWLVKNIDRYEGSKNHLYLAGHSAGAYNAAMLAVNNEYLNREGVKAETVKGVVGLAGPYDFLPLVDPKLIKIFNVEKDLNRTQALNYVKKGVPPFLLLTGTKDDIVSPHHTDLMYEKLKKYGNEVEIKTYSNLGHIGIVSSLATPFRGRAPILEDVADFINRH